MKKRRKLFHALGEKLFPGDAPWQRRKKVLMLLLAVMAGLLVGIFTIGLSWMEYWRR